jgi:LmbE family N-acetylglucosaminyl deacetylase
MNLLVISPHADDETLGAGGTLLKYKDEGNKIYWLNITNMEEEYGYQRDDVAMKQQQINQICKMYNMDGFYDLGLRPAGLDLYNRSLLINEIAKIIELVQPEVVILPYKGDVHTDHKIVCEAAYSCTKNFRYPSIKKILSMEIVSETNYSYFDEAFGANYYVNIEDHLEKKINIMKIYEKEIGLHPFPRSEEALRALAILRGSSAGFKYAEAFRVEKIIEN